MLLKCIGSPWFFIYWSMARSFSKVCITKENSKNKITRFIFFWRNWKDTRSFLEFSFVVRSLVHAMLDAFWWQYDKDRKKLVLLGVFLHYLYQAFWCQKSFHSIRTVWSFFRNWIEERCSICVKTAGFSVAHGTFPDPFILLYSSRVCVVK